MNLNIITSKKERGKDKEMDGSQEGAPKPILQKMTRGSNDNENRIHTDWGPLDLTKKSNYSTDFKDDDDTSLMKQRRRRDLMGSSKVIQGTSTPANIQNTSSSTSTSFTLNQNTSTHIPVLCPDSKRKRRTQTSILPCEVCGKSFDRPSLLQRHFRTHTGEKPYICDVCSKGFNTRSGLNTHRRIHSGEKPHQCPTCGKTFTASSNLYYHRMTHIKEKPHKCMVCEKSFMTPGDLKSHQYVHSGTWPYKCPACQRGFSKHLSLQRHVLLHCNISGNSISNKPDEKQYSCHICEKKFALVSNLQAHIKTHEEVDPASSTCITCKRSFLTSMNILVNGLCVTCTYNATSNSKHSGGKITKDTTSPPQNAHINRMKNMKSNFPIPNLSVESGLPNNVLLPNPIYDIGRLSPQQKISTFPMSGLLGILSLHDYNALSAPARLQNVSGYPNPYMIQQQFLDSLMPAPYKDTGMNSPNLDIM